MSFYEKLKDNLGNNVFINSELFQLYVNNVLTMAASEHWDKEKTLDILSSFQSYVNYLSDLNDLIVQEICDVRESLYGPLT